MGDPDAFCHLLHQCLGDGTAFVGCGQSGTLHMPNDPNYDKRAKYLLYKDAASKPSAQRKIQRP